MVISQPPGTILHIIIVLHQRCLNCSECFQRHLMFYTCNYNIRVTHRNGAIKHIFINESTTEGSSADCSLFILSLHALALHLAVEILLQIFLYEDLSTLAHIHLSVVFPPRMPAGFTLLQPIPCMKNIPNIWHKSSTKHGGQTRLKR